MHSLWIFCSPLCRHTSTFEFHAPQDCSFCFPRLTTKDSIADFCNVLVKKTGVLLLPATLYEAPDLARRGHFRLGLGRKNFAQGLTQLEDHLQEVLELVQPSWGESQSYWKPNSKVEEEKDAELSTKRLQCFQQASVLYFNHNYGRPKCHALAKNRILH